MQDLSTQYVPNRTRLIVRRGLKNFPMQFGEIALFYTESKVVYAIDRNNNKFLCDHNLGVLETMLDKKIFFRANRQYIININFIKNFQACDRVKLKIEYLVNDSSYDIIISQLTVGEFRRWISEA